MWYVKIGTGRRGMIIVLLYKMENMDAKYDFLIEFNKSLYFQICQVMF